MQANGTISPEEVNPILDALLDLPEDDPRFSEYMQRYRAIQDIRPVLDLWHNLHNRPHSLWPRHHRVFGQNPNWHPCKRRFPLEAGTPEPARSLYLLQNRNLPHSPNRPEKAKPETLA